MRREQSCLTQVCFARFESVDQSIYRLWHTTPERNASKKGEGEEFVIVRNLRMLPSKLHCCSSLPVPRSLLGRPTILAVAWCRQPDPACASWAVPRWRVLGKLCVISLQGLSLLHGKFWGRRLRLTFRAATLCFSTFSTTVRQHI